VTDLEQVLAEVARALDAAGVPYMVIGGMANAIWGKPRGTLDVDITVGLSADDVPRLLAILGEQVANAPPDPGAFARDTGVLPFTHRRGPRVELMLAFVSYAHEALARAVTIAIGGVPVKFCTPEDLILHKIISSRERDRSDVAALIALRRETLDRTYLDPHVHELAWLLEDPSIEERYAALLAG
jgi:hypothetical protein